MKYTRLIMFFLVVSFISGCSNNELKKSPCAVDYKEWESSSSCQ